MKLRHRIRCFTAALAIVAGSFTVSSPAADDKAPAAAHQPAADGWITLFDGKTPEGWRGLGRKTWPDKGWNVQDGCIHHIPKGGGGDITYDKPFNDFELVFEWKVAAGANSGVKYRVQEAPGKTGALGPEYQLIDDARHSDARSSPKRGTASLYDVFPPKQAMQKPAGEFNESRIIARGNHIEHWLNGMKVVEAEFGSPEWESSLAASKFKGNKTFASPKAGQIVIQDHGDEIWLRNIKLRELK